MLTGAAAFDRGSAVETMAAIAGEECRPISALNDAVPEPLAWIVNRCLAKDRECRYASTFDLYYDLKFLRDRIRDYSGTQPPQAPKPRNRKPLILAILMCATLLASSALLLWSLRGTVDFHQYRLSPLATTGVFEGEPAWSPDGKNVAYTGDVGHVRQVFVRNLSANGAAQITHAPRDCSQPFWATDGSLILSLPRRFRRWRALVCRCGGRSLTTSQSKRGRGHRGTGRHACLSPLRT